MIVSISVKKNKNIEDWTNRDFIIYFASKMNVISETPYKIAPVAWQSMLGRVKGFRTKLNLDNVRYKKFIDRVFDMFFTREKCIPVFGAIVSEKVFFTVEKLSNQIDQNVKVDWLALRDHMYNNALFHKL